MRYEGQAEAGTLNIEQAENMLQTKAKNRQLKCFKQNWATEMR